MHFHFPFSAPDILWTLAFAGQLVLLVVLMGRDRMARFPWFTAAAVLTGLRLLCVKLLSGRLPQMTMARVFIVMAEIASLLGLLVILEIARRAFGTVRRSTWVTWSLALLVLGGIVLAYWGSWPAWKTVRSTLTSMQMLQLMAQKTALLVDLENVAVGILVVFFGHRYSAGWRSHTQQIVIGLSTASLAQISIGILWERIVHSAAPHSMAEYQRLVGLRDKLFNANSAMYVVVLVWWIVWLWRDEPGQGTTDAARASTASEEKPDLGSPKAGSLPA